MTSEWWNKFHFLDIPNLLFSRTFTASGPQHISSVYFVSNVLNLPSSASRSASATFVAVGRQQIDHNFTIGD